MGEDGGCDSDCSADESASAPDPHDVSLSLNAMLEVLAHHHRRELLRMLVDAPAHTATIDELTTRLRRQEEERTGEQPGRAQIEMTLHHVHLPKLTDVGLVEYDPRSQELRYRHCDRLEDLLEHLESVEWN